MHNSNRVIIVGAGLAAIYAALQLAPRPVLILSPDKLGRGASSAWAQGGVAAAMHANDSPEAHAADTISAGAGLVDKEVATFVTQAARDFILDLTSLGTPFDRNADGTFVMSREAAHSFARVVRVRGDQAGHEIMETLIEKLHKTASIQVIEGVMATGLEIQAGALAGVWISSAVAQANADQQLINGSAYLLAGGGSGGLFALTTNPPRICGQVIGMAARAGAIMADTEFVQFHPTAIAAGEDPAPLATEALRGEGAILINKNGERFMQGIHPDGELAPRDIVARAIFAQSQAGLMPMLDTRAAIGAAIHHDFPAVSAACARAGIDPAHDPIPVAAAAHYHMGGVKTNLQGQTSLPGLWACGEVTATGLHGANRLASNGLLEALVFAQSCADDIVKNAPVPETGPAPETAPLVKVDFINTPSQNCDAEISALRQTMTDNVGVVRTATGLRQALCDIARLEASAIDNRNFLNMTATATLIAATALLREESRGGHFRDDFPNALPEYAKQSSITLRTALALRAKVALENS